MHLNKKATLGSPSVIDYGGFCEGEKHLTEVLKEDAINFINKIKTKDDSFFMHLAFNAPYDPRKAPQRYIDMFPLDV